MTGEPKRKRRWPWFVLLGLVLLVGLPVTGVMIFLTSDGGAALVRSKALTAINDSIAGKVEFGHLSINAGFELVFDDFKLFTPEGELVLEAKRVTLNPAVWALSEGRVKLTQAKVQQLHVYLKSDERGLNLLRAVASKTAGDGQPGKLDLLIEDLAVTDASLDFESGEQHTTLDALHLEGRARIKLPDLELGGSVHLGANVKAPLEDTLAADFVVRTPKAGEVAIEVTAETSDSKLKGSVSPKTLSADIEQLHVTPKLVRAFVPAFKLKVPIDAKGTASLSALDFALNAGDAKVTAKGSLHPGALFDRAELDVEDFDPSQVIEGGRPSRLEAHLEGRLNDAHLEALDAAVAGKAKWSEAGRQLAEVTLEAKSTKGEVEVTALKAKVPGAEVEVQGGGDASAIALTGHVEATDVHAVVEAIAGLTGIETPAVTGSGSLAIIMRGPILHPWLSVDGNFKSFGFNALQIYDLRVDAQAADIQRPLEAKGNLKASRFLLGDTEFQQLLADVTTEGRHLVASVSTQQAKKLALKLQLDGMLDVGEQGVVLTEVTLEYPPERWLLDQPSHIVWKGGDVTIDTFSLTSRDAHLTLEGGLHDDLVDVTVALQGYELAHLPSLLVPASVPVTGRADAKVHALGKSGHVETDLELTVKDGTVRGVKAVALTAKAHAGPKSLDGTVALTSAAGDVEGTFSVPSGKPSGKSATPPDLAVHLAAKQIDLAQVSAAVRAVFPVDGTVALTLDVTGTVEQPLPTLRAESTNLKWCRGPCPTIAGAPPPVAFDRVVFTATPQGEHALDGALDVTAAGGLITLRVGLPKGVTELGTVDWLQTPLKLALEANGIDLATLSGALQLTVGLGGKLQVKVGSEGPLSAPNVTMEGAVAGFQTGDFQPVDLTGSLKSDRDETRVELLAKHGGKQVLLSHGRLGGPLERLWHEAELTNTGLLVDADLGPMQLGEVWQTNDVLEEAPPTGTLRAQLSVSGSAAAPKGSLRGTFEQLTVGKVALGQANLAWDYQAGKHVFSTAISSIGTFKSHGELMLDVSLPAILKGLDVAHAPFEASFKADQFDLAFLSGVHPVVRTLGGKLKLDAEFKGVVSNPGFKGSMEWTDGRLGIAGYGDYKQAHVRLDGDDAGYRLSDLSARAGGGEMRAKGEAKRVGSGLFTLTGNLDLNKFPIVTDDQLLAIASSTISLEGEASSSLIDVKRLAITSAHVELPDVKRKNLQALDRPGDIILVRNGVPVARKKKKAPVDPAAPRQVSRLVRVLIDAPDSIFVKSSDVTLELGLSDKFRLELADQLLLYGEVTVVRGRLDVIGRKFEIERDSRVRFAGAAAQPYVNVTAVHVNQREGVTVFVTVVGRGTDYSLKTSSQPPLPDSEIFTLLTTGRRSLKVGGGGSSISAGDAASVLGSLAASQLKTLLAKKVPIDVLSVEGGEGGIETTRVEAGIYLTDRVYLGYQLSLGADRRKGENVNAGKIEYQLDKHLSVEGTAGDAPAVGAALVWSTEY